MAKRNQAWWKQINGLLDKALKLDPSERAAYLHDACDDESVRSEVASLLSELEDAEARGFLDAPVGAHAEALAREALGLDDDGATSDLTGQEIGAYRIVRELGRGGMGAVFLAERADGEFEQHVALKLMRGDLVDRDDLMARLRRERQILADLHHEHIARLLDGGVDRKGRPYLVMEYVEGERIDQYCDAHGLDIEARIHLFLQVGEAVAAAHRRAVIHRDLKPSNILVTSQESGGDGALYLEPRAKLLDFGIAKLLNQSEADQHEPITRKGTVLLTPEYAAPEQIEDEGITTATDVYQLGVLLYELLTGEHPFGKVADGKRGPGRRRAIEDAILSTEPERPSAAVTRMNPDLAQSTRGSDTVTLTRQLRGDLDAICLKAMRKDSEERYQSVDAFLEDIHRFLSDKPVGAHQGALLYRTQKYAKRNWKALTTTALFIATLTGGSIFYTIQVAQERDRAQLEAQKAEQVSDFLVNLFDVSDPYSTQEVQGDTVSAGFLLKRGAERISEELRGQPEVQSTMLNEIGRIYTNLSFYNEAESLVQRAVQLRKETFGPLHPDVAESMVNLSKVHYRRGEYDESEALSRRALKIRHETLARDDVDIAESLNNLAVVLERKGEYAEAEKLHRSALDILKSQNEPNTLEVAATQNNLGVLLEKIGDYEESESFHREALNVQRSLLPPQHPAIANNLRNIGEVLRERGKYAEAESFAREALSIFRASFESDHPEIAFSLNDVAIILEKRNKLKEAEELHREALELKIRRFGENNSSVATSLHNLAVVLDKQGRYEESEDLHRQVLELDQSLLGQKHPWVATDMNDLATVLAKQGKYDQAKQLYRQALELRRKLLGDDHPHVGFTLSNLGEIHTIKQQFEEAERLLLRAYDILEQTVAEEHFARQNTLKRLVTMYEKWSRPDAANQWESLLVTAGASK